MLRQRSISGWVRSLLSATCLLIQFSATLLKEFGLGLLRLDRRLARPYGLDGLAGKVARFVDLEHFGAAERVPDRLVISATCRLAGCRLRRIADGGAIRLHARRHDPDIVPRQFWIRNAVALPLLGQGRDHPVGQGLAPLAASLGFLTRASRASRLTLLSLRQIALRHGVPLGLALG